MTKYDSTHHAPPAPVAWVKIVHPITNEQVADVPMLIDSGADVTLLPEKVIKQLRLEPNIEEGVVLEGFEGGTQTTAYPVTAIMELGGFRFKGSYVFADREIGVVGRNILNNLIIELNGPGEVWSMRR